MCNLIPHLTAIIIAKNEFALDIERNITEWKKAETATAPTLKWRFSG